MTKKVGIYMILCTEDGKKYIGKSVRIYTRWYQHRWDLKNNCACSLHLQRAWNKYGEEKFIFHIIEECSEELLTERENYYIEHYKTLNPNFGYNVLHEALQDKKIEENRNKPRESDYNINRPAKSVISINIETGEFKQYQSYKEVGGNLTIVQECLATWKSTEAKKKVWTISNCILMYQEDYNEDINYKQKLIDIKEYIKLEAAIKRTKEKQYKPVQEKQSRKGKKIKTIHTETNEEIIHPNIKQMIRDLKLTEGLVRKCLSLKFTNTQHKGYRFELLENNSEIP